MESNSSCVLIKNLRRPFTIPQLKSKLEEFGQIQYFWIDTIKSHCYVQFANPSQASDILRDLNNTVWPEETGLSLSVSIVLQSECHKNGVNSS